MYKCTMMCAAYNEHAAIIVPGHFSGQVLPVFIECEIWYSDGFSLYVSGL